MRKSLLFLTALLIFSVFSYAQTTYYWVGGVGAQNAPVLWAPGWNTAPDGSGTSRTVSSGSDILIIDGNSTLLSSKTIHVAVPKDSCAQLQLLNGVTVIIDSTTGNNTDAAIAVTYGSTYTACVIPVYASGIANQYNVGDFIASTFLPSASQP